MIDDEGEAAGPEPPSQFPVPSMVSDPSAPKVFFPGPVVLPSYTLPLATFVIRATLLPPPQIQRTLPFASRWTFWKFLFTGLSQSISNGQTTPAATENVGNGDGDLIGLSADAVTGSTSAAASTKAIPSLCIVPPCRLRHLLPGRSMDAQGILN